MSCTGMLVSESIHSIDTLPTYTVVQYLFHLATETSPFDQRHLKFVKVTGLAVILYHFKNFIQVLN